MDSKKVLVTGMSGLIGNAVYEQLRDKHQLSALNRRAVTGVECYQADIADLDAIQPAFEGKDTVVHLAANADGDASWEDVLHHNVIGTYNVFEAARRAGVGRIIYASSGAATSGWELEPPYDALAQGRYEEVPSSWEKLSHQSPTRPSGLYGCSKVLGEALARRFSDECGMSTICLRIGAVNKEDRPLETRQWSVWCSQRDIVQMIEKCIDAPDDVRFDIFYAVSKNKWSYRDWTHARDVVGYEPQDEAEDRRS
jgi:nucleoside-diphosphate-sugar epimerase